MRVDAAWSAYLQDVYGGVESSMDASQFTWLYWSSAAALAKKPLRIWVLPNSYKDERPSLERAASELLDEMVEGDGVLHMYSELGFFRWVPGESPATFASHERRWAEVLRASVPKEDGTDGTWFYALHGSGFYLDLGRELDTTCDPALVSTGPPGVAPATRYLRADGTLTATTAGAVCRWNTHSLP